MSSPIGSQTPERAAANPSFRRSFTLPARIANRPSSTSTPTSGSDGIETLFTHTSSKIVSFTAANSTRQASPSRRHHDVPDSPSFIPWRSPAERTLAVGVLRIYRVTSSNVSFLNSGNLLHTIFPKSQCWCVDGESVFVLRIRQDSYYRIELPCQTDEHRQKIEDFKVVLGQVLQYEKTQCPFKRGFEVDIPERPKTPPRRRPKKPTGKAKKWLFDKTWVPEDGPRPSTPVLEGSDSGTTSPYEEDDRSSVNTDTNEAVSESPATALEVTPPKPAPVTSVTERAKLFQGLRSVTAPSGLGIASMASPEMPAIEEAAAQVAVDEAQEQEPAHEHKKASDSLSLISSTDSFYSLENSVQRSPSPPYLDAEAEVFNPWAGEHGVSTMQEQEPELRGRGLHRRQVSEATVRPVLSEDERETPPVTPTNNVHPSSNPTIDVHPSSAPSTPPLVSDSEEDSLEPPFLDVPTPPDNIRLKRLTGASQRRAFSPMPHPQNLFCPPAQPRKQFTAALVRRTCELILGPPAHLVTLMLSIAARVSNGFGFNTYRVRHTGEKIPCSWESSEEEDEWEEDDYGIPLGNLDREGSALKRRARSGELD
ncbi:inheritance of peroxisomes protein 1-domain-containing protein [Lophiotrema nucula]|uniref:Inheritance of peroxisomes protein 1 n=1 Tax=Lophiotrema nucula TaxID=690887 RepID=A0A6A5YGC1_9PLEO|nr:inheritance of peroxisomes protein 1-domain-containing protein [Lophiotrema nucula]